MESHLSFPWESSQRASPPAAQRCGGEWWTQGRGRGRRSPHSRIRESQTRCRANPTVSGAVPVQRIPLAISRVISPVVGASPSIRRSKSGSESGENRFCEMHVARPVGGTWAPVRVCLPTGAIQVG